MSPLPESPDSHALDVAVIGAGLAGLACAVKLHEAGRRVEVFEASDGVGGRVRTDRVEGFLLDRGFQVYLDAYPEAGALLDLKALDLRPFTPGALVWKGGKLRSLRDVFRNPASLVSSALAPVGNLRDKCLVAKLRFSLLRKPLDHIWAAPETSTLDYLRAFGFSEQFIDDFFRSFYGGIFLEDQLTTSSRLFEFTFKMFTTGSATLPQNGMRAIPEQLAARLPDAAIHLHSPVTSVTGDHFTLADRSGAKAGDDVRIENEADTRHRATAIVLATDASTTARLLGHSSQPRWNRTSCLYFAADEAPLDEPIIALRGDREGLIHNLCVPSRVAPGYAPEGQSLISISVIGDHDTDATLTEAVERELVDWFGEAAKAWTHLRTEHLPRALPIDPPGHAAGNRREQGVWICGDHTRSGSIEGAIQSGLEAAAGILGEMKE
ncbi:MAG: FAD-dependent oxidoreductase [Verrucomicrobiales bacterium]|nr:FAD-dependent oxidoreductase [Verrucomicrobiales bacterium]